MFIPLVLVSFFYDFLSLCLLGMMNWRAGAPFFITGEGMMVVLFFVLSFIGGLVGVVARGIYEKLHVFQR